MLKLPASDYDFLSELSQFVRQHPEDFRASGQHLDQRFCAAGMRRARARELLGWRAATSRKFDEQSSSSVPSAHLMYPPGSPVRRSVRSGVFPWRPTAEGIKERPAASFAAAIHFYRTIDALSLDSARAICVLTWCMFDESSDAVEVSICTFQMIPWKWDPEQSSASPHMEARELIADSALDAEWVELARKAMAKVRLALSESPRTVGQAIAEHNAKSKAVKHPEHKSTSSSADVETGEYHLTDEDHTFITSVRRHVRAHPELYADAAREIDRGKFSLERLIADRAKRVAHIENEKRRWNEEQKTTGLAPQTYVERESEIARVNFNWPELHGRDADACLRARMGIVAHELLETWQGPSWSRSSSSEKGGRLLDDDVCRQVLLMTTVLFDPDCHKREPLIEFHRIPWLPETGRCRWLWQFHAGKEGTTPRWLRMARRAAERLDIAGSVREAEGSAPTLSQALAAIEAAEPPEPDVAQGVFYRDGDGWHVGIDGRVTVVVDLMGMTHIQTLLRNADVAVSVDDLIRASGGAVHHEHAAAKTITSKGQKQIAQAVEDLEERKRLAISAGNVSEQEECDAQLNSISRFTRSALDLKGRPKLLNGLGDARRKTVGSAIRRALKAIKVVCPELHDHLVSNLQGRASYNPRYVRGRVRDWKLE